jgi:negative regulator of flagellin synthesis FlgM
MKINGSDPHSKLGVYQAARVQKMPAEASGAKHSTIDLSWMDRVELSDQGQLVADAQRAIADIPDVRQPLVSRIQNDIQSGAYTVDAMAVAEGMLRESLVNQAAMAW